MTDSDDVDMYEDIQIPSSTMKEGADDTSSPILDAPSSPVVDTPTSPIQDAPSSPAQETPTSSLQDAPASPVQAPSPVVDTPTSPIQDAPTSPVQDAPISPVQDAPTSPVQDAPISPVQDAPTSPVQDAPISPVQDAPTSPVQDAPTSPVQDAPTSSIQDAPTSSIQDALTSPVQDAPTSPVQDAPSSPVGDAPTSALQGTPSPSPPASPASSTKVSSSTATEREPTESTLEDKSKVPLINNCPSPAQDIEPMDLEEGELEDDEEEEEEEEEIVEKPVVKESSAKNKGKVKKSSSSSKSKKGAIEAKEELDPVKRLLAEVKEKDTKEKEEREKRRKDKKRSHKEENKDKSKEKDSSKKKKRRISEDEDEGGEFLFIRGASPGAGGDTDNWDMDRRGVGKRRRGSEENSPGIKQSRRGHEGSSSPIRERGKRPDPRREPKSDIICAYFMQGKCQKSSDQCSFSHDAVPPRKMELCKFWMLECCAKKEKCLYLHNDFPCKFFHTGLVCRKAENCKFSHQPLSDVTKQVLLKHIETAPKEILGDFPRLNRTGALNLINKMEAKLKGEPFVEEDANSNNDSGSQGQAGTNAHYHGHDRHGGGYNNHDRYDRSRGNFGGPPMHENNRGRGGGMDRGNDRGQDFRDNRDRRQSRWEQTQPTRGDQEKLQELMTEAGISGFYKETLGDSPNNQASQPPPPQAPINQAQFPQMLPMLPPHVLPPTMLPPPPQGMNAVNNPALASVLASLNIPSSSIVPPYPPPSSSDNSAGSKVESNAKQEPSEPGSVIPDNLPKMQRDLYLRIQQQQIKNENKVQTQLKPEPEEPEENWYSDDEEEETKKKEELKAEINDQISSALSQIRQQSQQQSSAPQEPDTLKTFFGDTDLRTTATSSNTNFQDVDLRTSTSSIFKKINILPATEINASLSSHGPVTYKVFVVAGLRDKPDYSHVRQSLTTQAILMDPRFGPRNSIPAPASPTDQSSDNLSQPMSIPNSSTVFDPRMKGSGGGGGGSQLITGRGLLDAPPNTGRGLLETPNPFETASMPGMGMMVDFNNPFNRDPRAQAGPSQPPPNPAAAQLAQNFASLMQQQWPNNGQPPMDPSMFMLGFPFMPNQGVQPPPVGMDFNMIQNLRGIRPPFMQGNPPTQQPPPIPQPASSWERFNRGQGNLSPPL